MRPGTTSRFSKMPGYRILFQCTLYPDTTIRTCWASHPRWDTRYGCRSPRCAQYAGTGSSCPAPEHTHKQNARDQCCVIMTFWYGSIHRTRFGAGSDSGSRSCYFRQRTSRRLTKTYLFNLSFSAFYFLKLHLLYFTKIKSY